MKLANTALLAAALALVPAGASAQDAGATVYGNDDAPIGTVESNADGIVTVDTGTHKAPLPADLLAEREGKWTVNATKAQIDSMMAAQMAEAEQKLNAALVKGAAVMTADNMSAGTILAIDETADQIIIERDNGIVSLMRKHFAVSPEGNLMALFSMEQIVANTTEVPEGAEIRTASGVVVRNADGTYPEPEMTASADSAGGRSGASE
jgi:hypothetical protein